VIVETGFSFSQAFSQLSHQPLVAGGILAVIILAVGFFLYRRWSQTTTARIERALKLISHDQLNDVFFADGMGGYIHIDALLLTNRGLLVLDIKDVSGTLFGAEKMDEWVVMDGKHRHGFRNPLHALHDRVATIRSHARNVHVEGYLVFTDNGRFAKGMPAETVMLGELVETIGPAGDDFPQAFDETWRHLKKIAEQDHTLPPHA
jgi:hypothetical protein